MRSKTKTNDEPVITIKDENEKVFRIVERQRPVLIIHPKRGE